MPAVMNPFLISERKENIMQLYVNTRFGRLLIELEWAWRPWSTMMVGDEKLVWWGPAMVAWGRDQKKAGEEGSEGLSEELSGS